MNEAELELAESMKSAVALANSLRERLPGEQLLLADLPPGKPRNPGECLLARAFNFNCTVDASPAKGYDPEEINSSYEASFFGLDIGKYSLLKEWAESENLEYSVFDEDDRDYGISIRLPNKVGVLAYLFDQDDLPDQYYETHYDEEYYPNAEELGKMKNG